MKRISCSVWRKGISLCLAVMIFSLPLLAQVTEARTAEQRQAIAEAEKQAEIDADKWLWFALGFVGNLVTVLIVYVVSFKPPQSALLGKSPEYVAAYTDAYERKLRSIRSNYALYGCCAGSAVAVLAYLLFVVAPVVSVVEALTYY